MRIELDPTDVVIIAGLFKGNGQAAIRYTMVTKGVSQHFTVFEKLVKALKKFYKIPQEPA